jgi:hypothetical protein
MLKYQCWLSHMSEEKLQYQDINNSEKLKPVVWLIFVSPATE